MPIIGAKELPMWHTAVDKDEGTAIIEDRNNAAKELCILN
jgi:hypothetical protein